MASKSSVFTVVVAGKSTLSKVVDNDAKHLKNSTDDIARHFNKMSSRIGGSMTTIGEKMGSMNIVGSGAFTAMGTSMKQFETKSGHMKDIFKGAMKQVGLAALGGATAVATFSLKAAEDYAAANNSLKASVEGSGGSWKKVSSQIEKVQGNYHKFGKTSAQINSALATSIISTGSYAASIKHLPIALDLAQAKHMDLNAAMLAIDKAASGNSRVLKQLGIDIAVPTSSALKLQQAQTKVTAAQQNLSAVISNFPNAANAGAKGHEKYMKAVDKVKAAEKKLADQHGASKMILNELSKRVGGQAAAAAETYAMKLKAARAQATDLAAKLGDKLQPAISAVLDKFSKFIDYANKHTWVWKTLIALIGTLLVAAFVTTMAPIWTLVAGFGSLLASVGAATLGFFGFDVAAMAAAGGLSALTAAFMATGIGAIILLIIGLIVLMIFKWQWFLAVIKVIWKGIWAAIKFEVDAIWWYIETFFIKPFIWVWDKIKKPVAAAFSWIGTAITAPFKLAMDVIKNLWNSTIGGFTFNLPDFLGGGTFTIPVLGASGPSGAAISTKTVGTVTKGVGAVGAGGLLGVEKNGTVVNINVHGGDPNQVVAAIVKHTKRNGPIPVRSSLPAATPFTVTP